MPWGLWCSNYEIALYVAAHYLGAPNELDERNFGSNDFPADPNLRSGIEIYDYVPSIKIRAPGIGVVDNSDRWDPLPQHNDGSSAPSNDRASDKP